MTHLGDETLPSDLTGRFQACGIAVIEHALSEADLTTMDAAFPVLPPKSAGARAAAFSPDALHWLRHHEGLSELASQFGGACTGLARVLAFDKSAATNWFVPWHQDRAEDGIERPAALLARMVALRIHLDDCGEDDGPLDVIARSHTLGRLDSAALAAVVAKVPPLTCLAARGDIVAMRPLIVHRSQRARRPSARRVLHLEYGVIR